LLARVTISIGKSIFSVQAQLICNQQVVGSNPTAGYLNNQALTLISATTTKSVFAICLPLLRRKPLSHRHGCRWIRNAAKAYPRPARLRFDYGSGFELRCDRIKLTIKRSHLGAFLCTGKWNIGGA
jgi:hypothetical protein